MQAEKLDATGHRGCTRMLAQQVWDEWQTRRRLDKPYAEHLDACLFWLTQRARIEARTQHIRSMDGPHR